jgi:hypothetical protein
MALKFYFKIELWQEEVYLLVLMEQTREPGVSCVDQTDLYHLPVRMLGVTVKLTPQRIEPLRAIDPLIVQGGHPGTGTFF